MVMLKDCWVWKVGSSLVITVPVYARKYEGIKQGDVVDVIISKRMQENDTK